MNIVQEILNFWLVSEYVEQANYPEFDENNNPNASSVVCHADIKAFTNETLQEITISASNDRFHPVVSNCRYFAFGKLKRNKVVEYLIELAKRDELIEKAYKDRTSIAWFTFETTEDGTYQDNSFKLSKLLWSITHIKYLRNQQLKVSLDFEQYQNAVQNIEEELLKGKKYEEFIEKLYNKVFETYVRYLCDEYTINGVCAVYCYKKENVELFEINPLDMGRSFFDKDLEMVLDEVIHHRYGATAYEKEVIRYITAETEKNEPSGRVNISVQTPKEKMKNFFQEALNPLRSPMGKWPSQFQPALMQQVAINLAIDEEHPQPIFSVNGPPGTGKTTLLKEIISHYIVRRAKLLCDSETPDQLFNNHEMNIAGSGEKISFSTFKNDRINDYGILVTSCNNAAVENITKDLPKQSDLLDGIYKESKEKTDELQSAETKDLIEIKSLFNLDCDEEKAEIPILKGNSQPVQYEKDVFYTYYARRLFSPRDDNRKKDYSLGIDNWGLISAPLGKKANINDYCFEFLSKLYECCLKKSEERHKHTVSFKKYRFKFLEQYEIVQELQKKLHAICTAKPECERTKKWICFKKSPSQEALLEKYCGQGKKPVIINDDFIEQYYSKDNGFADAPSTIAQISNPWFTKRYNREREKLFYLALQVHREFVLNSECVSRNIELLLRMWRAIQEKRIAEEDQSKIFASAFQTLFLITPVISTTFASMQSLMSGVKEKGKFGLLIVDEAGQAPPYMAIGALFRCRHAMIVGDPKQVEPVVTAETDIIKELISRDEIKSYMKKELSVQLFADSLNPYGTYLGEDNDKTWVGCPLVVHRRCLDPMYTISNQLSYDGTMKQQTPKPKNDVEATFIFNESYWIDVTGKENGQKNHFVKEQGNIVIELLKKKLEKLQGTVSEIKLYVITPFTSVKLGIQEMVKQSELITQYPVLNKWCAENIGTVHTFQGKGTDEVIFLLGCDKSSLPAVKWVNKNIVNVAVTRAKYRFYAIGDSNLWEQNSAMKIAIDNLKKVAVTEIITSEMLPIEQYVITEPTKDNSNRETIVSKNKRKFVCPNCSGEVIHGKYGYFCREKCGMQLHKAYYWLKKSLDEEIVEQLLSGDKVFYKYNEKMFQILPEISCNEHQGKKTFIWKCFIQNNS